MNSTLAFLPGLTSSPSSISPWARLAARIPFFGFAAAFRSAASFARRCSRRRVRFRHHLVVAALFALDAAFCLPGAFLRDETRMCLSGEYIIQPRAADHFL